MPQSRKSLSRVCMGCVPVFITTNWPFGMDFSSSGVMRGRSIIWRERLALSFPPPLLTDPLMTVRLPRALDSTSAV